MLATYRKKAASEIKAFNFNKKAKEEKDKDKDKDKPCPGSKIRSGGKGRGLGLGKGKGPKGIPFELKKADLQSFLNRAFTEGGPEQIIKSASDRNLAKRVLAAVYKAARSHAG